MRKTLLFCFALIGFSNAQLSGNYTIDGGSAASATNYVTFASAVSDMLSGSRADGGPTNGAGLGGPVVFDVANGTYAEQVTITAITGSSSTNTVTFQGANSDSTLVLWQWPTGSGGNFVAYLNGGSFIAFRHMTIERTGTNTASRVIDIDGATTDITVENCRLINNYNLGTNTLSYTVNDQETTNSNDNLVFRNNVITGGRYAMFIRGKNCCGPYTPGLVVENNDISGTYEHGLFISGFTAPSISGNTVTTLGSSLNGIGIEAERCYNMQLTKNQVTGFTRYGIQVDLTDDTPGTEGVVANNFIDGGGASSSRYSLYINGSDYKYIYHNTSVLSTCTPATSSTSSSACYIASSNNIQIRNNILVSSCGGYALSTNSTANISASDYNDIITSGTNVGYWSGVRTDLSAWQTASSQDANSLSEDPLLTSPVYHPTNANLLSAGTDVSSIVADDIEGEARPGPGPDLGCDETVSAGPDCGVANWESPVFPICPGSNDIFVSIRNFGGVTLTSADIAWTVDGVPQTPFNWVGSLAAGATSAPIQIGTFNFLNTQRYDVVFWTENPNGGADGTAGNDTLKAPNTTIAMTGSYEIGTEFTSFQDAVDSLVAKGICSDVTINVANGTYNEQISIPEIPGAGTADGPGKTTTAANNRVTFQSTSGDSTDVVLTFAAATFADNYTLQFDGADYITFRTMTLSSSDAFDNQVVRFRNTATHNVLENNKIETISGANGDDVIFSDTNTDSMNTIQNNWILNGRAGIHFEGSNPPHNNTITITNNLLENYRYGIYLQYVDYVSIVGNTMIDAASNNTHTQGIYLFGCDSSLTVGSNIITKITGGNTHGIEILNCDGGLTGECAPENNNGNIYNNQILVGGGAGSAEGIYMNASKNHHFYYNTIHTTGTNQTTARAFYINGPQSATPSLNANVVLKNNIFSASIGEAIYNSVGGVIASDYNNFYVGAGTDLGFWDGTSVADLAALQTASSMDANSLSIDPGYAGATDLTATEPALQGVGTDIPCITTDITGQTRPDPPSLGSNEPPGVFPISNAFQFEGALVAPYLSELTYRSTDKKGTEVSAVVERAFARPVDFEEIAAVLINRTANNEASFRLQDALPVDGKFYYRARLIDVDGAYQYTPIVEVNMGPEAFDLMLMPNPVNANAAIRMRVPLASAGVVQVRVVDATGRIVRSQNFTHSEKGWLDTELPPIVASGVYVVQVTTPDKQFLRKLIVR